MIMNDGNPIKHNGSLRLPDHLFLQLEENAITRGSFLGKLEYTYFSQSSLVTSTNGAWSYSSSLQATHAWKATYLTIQDSPENLNITFICTIHLEGSLSVLYHVNQTRSF